MALTDLGTTGIKVNAGRITAKTPVTKNSIEDIWSFRVLVDTTWFLLEYTSQTVADAAYAAVTGTDYSYSASAIGTDVSDWPTEIVLRSTETDVQKALKRLNDYLENDIASAIAAAAAGIIGGVDTWKDDGVATTYLYKADGVTPATPPSWAQDPSDPTKWKNGCYVVRNDNSPTVALNNHGQLYGTTDNGANFYWITTWPYEADDIYTDVSDWPGNEILTSADDNAQKALKTLNTFMVSSGRLERLDFRIDGNSFALTNGQKYPWIVVPFNCTIYGWAVRASAADTFTADVEYASTISGTPASITGAGTKPNIAAAKSGAGSTMTGWTTSLTKNGVITVNISGSPSAATWATISLFVYKTA